MLRYLYNFKSIQRIAFRHQFQFRKFSTSQNNSNGNKKQNSNRISLYDIYQKTMSYGKLYYSKMKQINYYTWLILLLCVPIASYFIYQSEAEEYPINYFEQSIKKDENSFNQLNIQINIHEKIVDYKIYFQKGGCKYVVLYGNKQKLQQILRLVPQNVRINCSYKIQKDIKFNRLILISEIIGIILITGYFLKSSSLGGVKKGGSQLGNIANQFMNKKQFQIITKTNVKFQDVAGLDESKLQVQEFVDFLKNPEKYKKLGARIPKGVLLSGPPGTGKTMLAKACAGEANVPFLPVSGSDFIEIFVGVGASRVRDLFETAKQNSPSIIFIDEIDAVGRKRSGSHGSHDERDNTLNQILVEMDGFGTNSKVIVMAATNRQNLLDNALIRPGRFDRMVQVNLPDLQGRRQIFNVHLAKIMLQLNKTQEQYAKRLATLTPGFSGAQIANLCNQAAILAARHKKTSVDSHQLQMATERIIGGIQKKNIISDYQKKIVSVHQSGHAVVSWFLEGTDPLLKLTIIPRSKGSLGFAQYFVNQTKLNTKTQLFDRICFILGGRCAQQLFFGKITNGASDDLKKAYELAHSIVVKLGMNEEIGLIGYKDPQFLRPYSEQMGSKIDKEIIQIIQQCTIKTQKLVKQYESYIKNLSQQLFQKQTLTIRQIRRILGQRDFTSNQTYQKYLQLQRQDEQKLEDQSNLNQIQ